MKYQSLVLVGVALLSILTSRASAIVVEVPVTPQWMKENAKVFTIKAVKKEDGLVHFTITYHPTQPVYLIGDLKLCQGEKLLGEAHFPSTVRESSATYYVELPPEQIAGSSLEVDERSFSEVGKEVIPVPGGMDYLIKFKDFAPGHPSP